MWLCLAWTAQLSGPSGCQREQDLHGQGCSHQSNRRTVGSGIGLKGVRVELPSRGVTNRERLQGRGCRVQDSKRHLGSLPQAKKDAMALGRFRQGLITLQQRGVMEVCKGNRMLTRACSFVGLQTRYEGSAK